MSLTPRPPHPANNKPNTHTIDNKAHFFIMGGLLSLTLRIKNNENNENSHNHILTLLVSTSKVTLLGRWRRQHPSLPNQST